MRSIVVKAVEYRTEWSSDDRFQPRYWAGDVAGELGSRPPGFRAFPRDRGEAWSEFSLEPERLIDAGDKTVFIFQLTAKGKGSGVEVKRRDAMVSTVRDRKTVRIDYYNNEAQALETVGLSMQDARADAS